MNTHGAHSRYHPLSIGAHWLTLMFLIAVYMLIELRDLYPKGSDPREMMKLWHSMLGLALFALVFPRLFLRHLYPVRPIEPRPPAWQHLVAAGMRLILYVFLIAMPLLGWLMLNAKGKPVLFFGLELPVLAAPDRMLAKNIEVIHEVAGTIGYYLIGLHALAALFHHFIAHDNTLRRMSPWRRETLR